jgi:hypothetical protein
MPSSTAANEPSVVEKDTHSTVTQSQDNQNEYEDAERNYQPKTLKFWTILIGMYLSMFLVALVCHSNLLHALLRSQLN